MTHVEALSSALARAAEDSTSLKQRLAAAERLRKLLEGVVSALPERPALALSWLQKERATLDEIEDAELKLMLRDLRTECTTRTQEAASDVIRSFPQELEDRGVSVDSTSRHPRYSVERRLVDVELDTRKYVAVIRPRHGDVIREPLDPGAVAARVRSECARLLERPFDGRAFLKKLTGAHAVLSKPVRGEAATAVMVRDLAVQMAKPAKPRLDEFAIDLGRLLTGPAGESLTPSHTRDTDKGLLLYGLEQGGYIGSVDVRSKP